MIKKLRLSRGWTQEQLALFSGLNIRTIQRIERGQNPGLESLKCIAAAFGIEIMKLQKQNLYMDELFVGSTPILPAVSVKETATFYRKQLGFEIEILWDDPPYGVVARGQTIIEFGEGRKQFAGSGICNIFVSNIDEIYQELKNKDIEFVGDIADRDYGSRDFRIRDNNGNILILTSPLVNQQELLDRGNTVENS